MRKLLFLILLIPLVACSGPPNPLLELQSTYATFPDYTVVLDDMRNAGTFGNSYQHRYRIIATETVEGGELRAFDRMTDWYPVSKAHHRKYDEKLGLAVLSVKDGVVSDDAFPPAFNYVGDPRYGRWQTDAAGHEFWTFYSSYTLLDTLDDAFDGRRIRRRHYDDYRRFRETNRTYTAGGMFGTGGSVTSTTNPSFFERQASRQRSGFGSGRLGRSTGGGFRSAGGGFGK